MSLGVSPSKILTGGTDPGMRQSQQVASPPHQRSADRDKRLRSTGQTSARNPQILATGTEPPQVSGLPVAQIRWHRTTQRRQVMKGTVRCANNEFKD